MSEEDSGYTGGYGSPASSSTMSDSVQGGDSLERRAFSGSIAADPNATEDESENEDFTTADIERARKAIAASQATADKLLQGSRQLEQTIFGVLDDDEAIMSVDEDLREAKELLERHSLIGAWNSVRKADRKMNRMEKDVRYLRRNIAILHRLLQEKTVAENELESVLRKLRNVSAHAEHGEMEDAAGLVDGLIGDIAGGETSTLNPFLFRNFWLGVENRWPAGGDHGVLLIRLLNDGRRPLPPMRLKAPTPRGWSAEPESVDLPTLPPGGYVHLRFHLIPETPLGIEQPPLARRLSVMTAYEVRQGEVTCVVRIRNKSMETHRDILAKPWMPPSFTCETIPLINSLAPDEVAAFRIPLKIALDGGA